MTSCRKFDRGEFVRGFRAACARRGINPLEGATSFEVVRYRIERGRALRRTRRGRWWQRSSLWLECAPYRSRVEEEAIWNVFVESYDAEVKRLVRAQRRYQKEGRRT